MSSKSRTSYYRGEDLLFGDPAHKRSKILVTWHPVTSQRSHLERILTMITMQDVMFTRLWKDDEGGASGANGANGAVA